MISHIKVIDPTTTQLSTVFKIRERSIVTCSREQGQRTTSACSNRQMHGFGLKEIERMHAAGVSHGSF